MNVPEECFSHSSIIYSLPLEWCTINNSHLSQKKLHKALHCIPLPEIITFVLSSDFHLPEKKKSEKSWTV